jgi:aminoglycoside/choline kinase family phosphotransferase/dTDP-glucose pyrophosphorylase
MKAMILAAGFGTRLRPYTHITPKPLFCIDDQPLLDILIRQLAAAGCDGIIVNTHHLHRQIEDLIRSRSYPIPVGTRYEPQILGTGGAIRNVDDFWDRRPFIVINGDVYTEIDLRRVYEFHCRHRHAVTLVLLDAPEFNHVSVDPDGFITGFHDDAGHPPISRRLAFTGIQVLDPEVLDYIPAQGASSSIDAFRRMLADGRKLKAYVSSGELWTDIGSPQRYREIVLDRAIPQAFSKAFDDPPAGPVERIQLTGDGSERQWYRLVADEKSLILADHGIRSRAGVAEVDAFIDIGRHLKACGMSVPAIYHEDRFAGLVFVEDLGDTNLQTAVLDSRDRNQVIGWYTAMIDQLVDVSIDGGCNLDPSWTWQTPQYDKQLILERECRYFLEAFARDYLQLAVDFEVFSREFELLADRALEYPVIGFIHRDLQSRNIMLKNDRLYLIDFQGGRLGPLQYDLASLLIDPYVDLPPSWQAQLLDHCLQAVRRRLALNAAQFRRTYHYCALARNLQILGAFAYLSMVKGKAFFRAYIPRAVYSLQRRLVDDRSSDFPRLTALLQQIAKQARIPSATNNPSPPGCAAKGTLTDRSARERVALEPNSK